MATGLTPTSGQTVIGSTFSSSCQGAKYGKRAELVVKIKGQKHTILIPDGAKRVEASL